MANNENLIPIPGRLHSVATEGHVAGADEIYDDTQSKLQSAINADVAEDISDLQEIVGEGSVDTRIENAIKALDAEKSQTAGADGLALSITETDGKITSISGSIATDTYDSYGSASAAQEAAATDATTKVNAAKAELLGDAASNYNTLGKLEDAIQSETSTRETEIGTDSTSGTVKGRIKSLETLVGSTDVDSQIDAKINALDVTKSQTAGADGLALSIEEEDGKIKSISGSITANTYDAYGAASTAKSDLLGDAAPDYNTLGKLEDAIQAEATTRSGETEALDGRLDNIEEVIPPAASSSNQLADKSFVNSSISTATAEFQGSYNSVSDLELTTSATHAQIATALGTEISGADNNDYCFVQVPTADATPTDIAKVERYKYNGTAWSFEYELNNSGYTDAQWAAINSGITSNLVTAFGNKYDKPSTGIPSTDMTSDVQTSLGKADSAYQKPSGGIPDSDLTSAVQTSLDKADTAYQKPSGGIPASDLADGVIPDISGKANKSEMSVVDGTGADADKTTITIKDGISATVLKSHQDISGKQDVIDSAHKLAADLVDDTSSANKFTNATEKQTWNAKQDALTFNTIPSADNKVATMADIEDATENCAYLEEDDSSAVIADFDSQADTVWKKAQTLSNAEKSQVKTNLGLPQEIYSKTEVNRLITTPNQQYVTVATYASLPATGSADTVYRVSNYNGSTNQVDATMYSEYAWNGSDYTFLCVKSQVGEVFDITAYNSNTKYADLAAALGANGANVPEGVRKGGMSVKYVSNSDNKYIQARLMADSFSTDVTKWEAVDESPMLNSTNLIKSGGVYDSLSYLKGYDLISPANYVIDYYSYNDGTKGGSTGAVRTYIFLAKDFKYIECTTSHNDTNQPAIAFYSSTELNSSTYMKSASLQAKAGVNSYYAEIPEGCVTVLVGGATRTSFTPSIRLFSNDGVYTTENAIHNSLIPINGKISIIGDSISSFLNAVVEEYDTYYPMGDITSINDMWWNILLSLTNSSLDVNASYSGSRVTNTDESRPDFFSRTNILGTPDTIFVALGTNDWVNSVSIGNYDYESSISELSESEFIPAYTKGVKSLLENYSAANIVLLIFQMSDVYASAIKNIGKHYNLQVIDVRYYYCNNVHPDKLGMNRVAQDIVSFYVKGTMGYIPRLNSNNFLSDDLNVLMYSQLANNEIFFERHISKAAGIENFSLTKNIPAGSSIWMYIRTDSNAELVLDAKDSNNINLVQGVAKITGPFPDGHIIEIPNIIFSGAFSKIGVYTNAAFEGDILLYLSPKKEKPSNDIIPYSEYTKNNSSSVDLDANIHKGDKLKFTFTSPQVDRYIAVSLLNEQGIVIAQDIIALNTKDYNNVDIYRVAPVDASKVRVWSGGSAYNYVGIKVTKVDDFKDTTYITHSLTTIESYSSGLKTVYKGYITAGDKAVIRLQSNAENPLLYFSLRKNNTTVNQNFLKVENTDISTLTDFDCVLPDDADEIVVYSNAITEFDIEILQAGNVNNQKINSHCDTIPSFFLMTDFTNSPVVTRLNVSTDGKKWKLLKTFNNINHRDPFIFKHNGVYYLTGSPLGLNNDGAHIVIYSSTNLVNWSEYTTLIISQESLWEGWADCSGAFAPEIKFFDGIPYIITSLYFAKTTAVDPMPYRVTPYLIRLSSDMTEVISKTRITGNNISETYDFDVTIEKIGGKYFELSNSANSQHIWIGCSDNLAGPYEKIRSIPMEDVNDYYFEGANIVPVGDKIYIILCQRQPDFPSVRTKQLGMYICDNQFNKIEYHKLVGGAMGDNDTPIIGEHPGVMKADYNDLLNILAIEPD